MQVFFACIHKPCWRGQFTFQPCILMHQIDLPALPHLSSTPSSKPPVYSSVAAFLRASGPLSIPRGCSLFVWGAVWGATACHISHTRYSGAPFVWVIWAGKVPRLHGVAGFICSKLKLYAWRRPCIHTMHTVRRSFAFNLAVCMNSSWTCHFWRFSAIIASPNRNV